MSVVKILKPESTSRVSPLILILALDVELQHPYQPFSNLELMLSHRSKKVESMSATAVLQWLCHHKQVSCCQHTTESTMSSAPHGWGCGYASNLI